MREPRIIAQWERMAAAAEFRAKMHDINGVTITDTYSRNDNCYGNSSRNIGSHIDDSRDGYSSKNISSHIDNNSDGNNSKIMISHINYKSGDYSSRNMSGDIDNNSDSNSSRNSSSHINSDGYSSKNLRSHIDNNRDGNSFRNLSNCNSENSNDFRSSYMHSRKGVINLASDEEEEDDEIIFLKSENDVSTYTNRMNCSNRSDTAVHKKNDGSSSSSINKTLYNNDNYNNSSLTHNNSNSDSNNNLYNNDSHNNNRSTHNNIDNNNNNDSYNNSRSTQDNNNNNSSTSGLKRTYESQYDGDHNKVPEILCEKCDMMVSLNDLDFHITRHERSNDWINYNQNRENLNAPPSSQAGGFFSVSAPPPAS